MGDMGLTLKPFVFKFGDAWYWGVPSRPAVRADSWREAFDRALTLARVSHVAAETMWGLR